MDANTYQEWMRLVSENTEEDANGFNEDAGVHGNCLRTGSASPAIVRSFWRRCAVRSFTAPVIERRTGSIWARRADVVEWTNTTRPMGVR